MPLYINAQRVTVKSKISARLQAIISALPLKESMRILEVGCGTGAAAREIVRRLDHCFVLGIDRSAKAIEQSIRSSQPEILSGKLKFEQVAVEDFSCDKSDLFDLAFAVRVGALDGRHPEIEEKALRKIAAVLKPGGICFIDRGNPLEEINLEKYKTQTL